MKLLKTISLLVLVIMGTACSSSSDNGKIKMRADGVIAYIDGELNAKKYSINTGSDASYFFQSKHSIHTVNNFKTEKLTLVFPLTKLGDNVGVQLEFNNPHLGTQKVSSAIVEFIERNNEYITSPISSYIDTQVELDSYVEGEGDIRLEVTGEFSGKYTTGNKTIELSDCDFGFKSIDQFFIDTDF